MPTKGGEHMAISIMDSKRLVLKYDQGSFSFNKLDKQADETKLYQLAHILNSFQSERPPLRVTCTTKQKII
jgi:hypothetical protein